MKKLALRVKKNLPLCVNKSLELYVKKNLVLSVKKKSDTSDQMSCENHGKPTPSCEGAICNIVIHKGFKWPTSCPHRGEPRDCRAVVVPYMTVLQWKEQHYESERSHHSKQNVFLECQIEDSENHIDLHQSLVLFSEFVQNPCFNRPQNHRRIYHLLPTFKNHDRVS